MTIAEMIPTLDDLSLANLRNNALRLQAGSPGAKQTAAAELLPLIDAEVDQRAKAAQTLRTAQKATASKTSTKKQSKVS